MPFVTDNPDELPWAYVQEVDGKDIPFYGMAIDLWEVIETRLGIKTEYQKYDSIADMINALAAGKIDVIVYNLTVTYKRAKRIRFTYPWYDGWQRIAVDANLERKIEYPVSRYITAGLAALGILFSLSFLILFVRRRFEPTFPKRPLDGFSLSFSGVIGAVTSGVMPFDIKTYKQRWVWNLIAAFWALAAFFLPTCITSVMTSVMTEAKLSNKGIESLADLGNRPVGVISGSLGEELLKEGGFHIVPMKTVAQNWKAVANGKVAAYIGDGPDLEYYNRYFANRNIKLLPSKFHEEQYAFATHDAELQRKISLELIRLKEDGTLAKLKKVYLGTQEEQN
jgi:ABC-type amino acid transport substrate-binding protein